MKKGTLLALLLASVCSALFAGGWNNTLIGCRAIALGGAFIAVADDPSAVFYNPAGLVRQEARLNLSLDGFYIWPTHAFTSTAGRTAQSHYNTTLPQFFMTYRWSERITFGLGFYVPYAGGGVDWKATDLGYPLKSTMGVTSLTPAVAYQVSEKLSLGFTLNYYTSTFTLETDMAPLGPLRSEESGSALSAGLGLMFRPAARATFGLSVRGPAKIRMAGKSTLMFGPYEINLDSSTSISIPWDLEAGFAYRLSDKWLFSSSAQYTLWSTLDKVEKVIQDIPFMGDVRVDEVMDFRNILILRAGLEFLVKPGLALRGGVGFDRWASPAETLTPTNIDVDKVTLIGGIGYRTGKTTIDFVYVYGIGEEREKQVSILGIPYVERYNLDVRVVGVGLTFSF